MECLEQLMKSMEVMLSAVEQLKGHCGHHLTELMQLVLELRQEQQQLTQRYDDMAQELEETLEVVEELTDTKSAFDSKERQAQKLKRQL